MISRLKQYGLAFSVNRLGKNSLLSIAQALVSAISVFVTYRIMVREIGLEQLGLWSILMAGAATARMADMSGSAGLARFVAERQSRNDAIGVVAYIHTVLFSTLALNGLAACLIFQFATPLIKHFVDPKWASQAEELLPLALFSTIVLPAVTTTISSAIDGVQRAELRAYCNITASLTFVGSAWLLVPTYGTKGYGVALMIQQLLLWGLSWLTLKTLVQDLGWIPWRLSKRAFKSSFAFGAKIQLNSLASLLTEPLAKIMLASTGGLLILGYYELASRLVFTTKGVFVAGLQPIMPAMAGMQDSLEQQQILLTRAVRLTIIFSFTIFIGLIVVGPVFSLLILNKIDSHLMIIIIVLSMGSTINLFSAPLYFAAMAAGVMRWNILAQAVAAICILAAGLLFGELVGSGGGIVGGIAAGLMLSSLIIYVGNAKALNLEFALEKQRIIILGATLLVVSIALCFSYLIFSFNS